MITVIKRDGREVPYNKEKIANAVFSAAKAVGGKDYSAALNVANRVEEEIFSLGKEKIQIEEIQDIVEKCLIELGHAKVAKAYILYRDRRNEERARKSAHFEMMRKLTFEDAKDNEIKRENANIDGNSPMGTMLKYGSESAKNYFIAEVLPSEFAKAHADGDIHIHDLDFLTLTMTCCQIPLGKLLKNGFSTGHGFLRSPNSIESAAQLACIIMQANQNDQHGGQSIPMFDYDLARYVGKSFNKHFINAIKDIIHIKYLQEFAEDNIKLQLSDILDKNNGHIVDFISCDIKNIKNALDNVFENMPVNTEDSSISLEKVLSSELDVIKPLLQFTGDDMIAFHIYEMAFNMALEKTKKSTYQAMQALVHNLNTMHSRAGAQVPFTSINYGTDTSFEGRMIIDAVLEATNDGLGHGETPIFPIHIFKVKEGINYNKGDKNYDLFQKAIRVSAKRLFPNFSFIDAPFNLKYYKENDPNTEIAYMGCRTRVIGNDYDPEREIVTGRGNLSFTSINLPRLGIEAHKDIDLFFKLFEEKIDLVISQLLERLKIQSAKKVKNFPFLMGQGVWIDSEKLSFDDTIEEVIKHGTLSIGFIGLAECLTALTGCHHGMSEEAQKLGLKIVKFLRSKTDSATIRTGLNFSALATPAEGLSGRFVRIDKEKYGIIEGVTDKEYYTNSFHIPVSYNISAFEKIKLEAPYHALTNAGHISYVELDGDPLKNLDAFEKIIKCMKESGIGYGSINHPVDRCPVCGYTGIIDNECPSCSIHETESVQFERIRRITGYLVGSMNKWNSAKTAEEAERVKHSTIEPIL